MNRPLRALHKRTNPAEALQAIAALPEGGRVLLLGRTDTGKTTFARNAINFLAGERTIPIGLVDADIGQSEIGPPGTIGTVVVRAGDERLPLASLHSLPLLDAAFVGATAPVGHLLAMLAGAVQMTAVAERALEGHGRVVIDTPGFIAGPSARALIRAIAQALDPALILAFAREGELAPILDLFTHLKPPPVVAVVHPAPEVGRKSATVRAARRSARLAHFLAQAAPMRLAWDSINLVNSSLGEGLPLATHVLKFIGNVIGSPCLYGEQNEDGALYAIVERVPAKMTGIGALEEQFKTRRVTIAPQGSFQGLVCGLFDAHRVFLGVGLIQQIDYIHRAFIVLTPVRRPEAVAQIALGTFRARPDGREIGHIRPGTI